MITVECIKTEKVNKLKEQNKNFSVEILYLKNLKSGYTDIVVSGAIINLYKLFRKIN